MQTDAEIESFLSDAGWGGAARAPIAADFSSRRFYRLARASDKPTTSVLMCADSDQRTDGFIQIGALLRRIAIAAPTVYDSDIVRDLVLMEDFGDSKVGALLDAGAERAPFDVMAAQLLARLHKAFAPSMLGAFKVPLYNAALFTDQATLFLDHYFPHLFHRAAGVRERRDFVECWHTLLSPLDALPRSLVLRDFMPDNAMELEKPVLGQHLGVLDFQDAGLGCIAYDLASWCEEVRRDGGLARLPAVIDAYLASNPVADREKLLGAAQIYAAQRHVRVLGILVKLDRLAYAPRVWRALQSLVKEPALAPVRAWFKSCVPEGGHS